MSKYIKLFDTEEEYNSALPTLDLPNVSLIDSTMEVKFNNIKYGAEVGDIVLYDNSKSKFVIVKPNDYNTSTYPTSTYGVVGVAVYESIDGLRVVGYKTLDGSGSEKRFKWQNTNFDWGLPKLNTKEQALTDFNGKSNTKTILEAIKAYDAKNSTDNISGNIPQYIQVYETDGTLPSDWYIPAVGEFYKVYESQSVIRNSLQVVGDNIVVNDTFLTSSEYNDKETYTINTTNGNSNTTSKNNSLFVRPFTLLK